MVTSDSPEQRELEEAIVALEGARDTLGDAAVDLAIAALRTPLAVDANVTRRRKQATVMFVDIVGSTQLLQGRDPEQRLAVMDTTLTRLGEVVTDHGGRVVKFMGDGLMAVFGLPLSRENDPEMAVRAGLGVVDAATALAAELEAVHGVSGISVRVGINTGLVASGGATEADDTIIGDAVNLAARLESAAEPGTVLISKDTLQHVRRQFEVAARRTIEAKGFPNPVDAYSVVRRTVRGDGLDTRGIEGVEVPMIGRDQELARLLDTATALPASSGARVVTIQGDAGLGKSRLLIEFHNALEWRLYDRLVARATLESQSLAYSLVRDLIERRYEILGDDPIDVARTKLVDGMATDLAGDVDAEMKAHFIGQLIGLDFSDSPHVAPSLGEPEQILNRATMYLSGHLQRLAAERPVVALIEDLHWADAASLDVLDALVDRLHASRALVVATARPELAERHPEWGRGYEWVSLDPLTELQAHELVRAALVKVVDCPPDLVDRLVDQTAGNPYYMEEMIRMLIDDEAILPGEESWTIDGDRYSGMRIPPTLTGVIQARLDGLSLGHRDTLQQASVVGRIFWDSVIAYLADPTGDTEEVPARIEGLGARGMVRRRLTSTFSNTEEYAFAHEILRAVAYEGVLLERRRSYHSDVADWLIANTGGRSIELAGLIAGHLEQADRGAEAIDHLVDAAASALASHAIEMADRYYERALDLAADDDRRRFALLLGREKTLSLRGDRAKQSATLDELDRLATRPEERAEVGILRAWMHYFLGDYRAASEAARTAASEARDAGDSLREAMALRTMASAELATDGPVPMREAERAVDIARESGDLAAQAATLNVLALVAAKGGDYSAGRDHLLEVLELAREMNLIGRQLTALANLGVMECSVGNFERASAYFELSQALAAGTGDRVTLGHDLVNRSWATVSRGDWAVARDLAEKGIALNTELGHLDAVAEASTWLGHAHLGLGDADAARDVYAEAMRLRETLGQSALAMGARAGMARALAARGDTDEAVEHAHLIADHLDAGAPMSAAWEEFRVHLTAIEILAAAGDERHKQVLGRAHRQLMDAAGRLGDPEDRRTFLLIPWHRRIVELAEALPTKG